MTADDRSFDELTRLWRSQQTGTDGWNAEEVLMQVKDKSRKFDRSIFWRDVREVAAGVLVVVVMGGASLLAPGWMPKLGGLFMIACTVFVLARMLSVRRNHPSPREDLPLIERLRAELAKVDAQARLLRSVRRWYVLPLALGGTVWAVSLVPSIPVPPGRAVVAYAFVLAGSLAIFGLVGWVIDRLNRLAVTRHLEPYRDELQGMLDGARSS